VFAAYIWRNKDIYKRYAQSHNVMSPMKKDHNVTEL